ncbi:hypothetical protein ACUN0C_17085 [Faunimonas sp. B44]|uniref:hypothetical protein n=1 Tax=Faunimonas sp. B44 TaxID=3461493 RepID=UPI004043F32D
MSATVEGATSHPEEAGSGSTMPGRKKRAVVVIHGIGEQRPMETLRSFVDAVWLEDLRKDCPADKKRDRCGRATWIVPDKMAGSYELRRIRAGFVEEASGDLRTDFFEFYWADLMQGTTLQHLWSWVRGLLFRPPWTVPFRVMPAWLLLWAGVAAVVLILLSAAHPGSPPIVWLQGIFGRPFRWLGTNLHTVLLATAGAAAALLLLRLACLLYRTRGARSEPNRHDRIDVGLAAPTVIAIGGLLAAMVIGPDAMDGQENLENPARLIAAGTAFALGILIHQVVVPYLGDVARYVRAAPETVERRQAVRERGLALLNGLHECREYDRIFIVGHSLGAIIAYDLLLLLWAERGPSRERPPGPAAAAALAWLDQNLVHPCRTFELSKYRDAQRAVFDALRAESDSWLVSDFVTLGSPLTHADFLIAETDRHLERMKRERLVATSPPRANDKGCPKSMFYRTATGGSTVPHHAAVFASVRWTNIHHPPRGIFFGDFLSGPAQDHFGHGIQEIVVRLRRPLLCLFQWPLFTHTLYWEPGAGPRGSNEHLVALRRALELDL